MSKSRKARKQAYYNRKLERVSRWCKFIKDEMMRGVPWNQAIDALQTKLTKQMNEYPNLQHEICDSLELFYEKLKEKGQRF